MTRKDLFAYADQHADCGHAAAGGRYASRDLSSGRERSYGIRAATWGRPTALGGTPRRLGLSGARLRPIGGLRLPFGGGDCYTSSS